MRTLPELLGAAVEEAPDESALVGLYAQPLTYLELAGQAATVGGALRGLGIERTDRVALLLPNGPEAAAAFLAVASTASCAPLNPSYREPELDFYLTDLSAKALIIGAGMESPARNLARAHGIQVVELSHEEGAPNGAFHLHPGGDAARLEEVPDADDVALLLHTSGTTSRPKLVPLTHRNLCASGQNVAASLALEPHDRCLNVMPLFHIHGLVAAVLGSLWARGSVICTPGFHAPSFRTWLEELSPTWYTAVPTMHQAVLARPDRRRTAPGLRLIRSSSAPLPTPVLHELEQTFQVPVIEAYGMTEAAHQMTSNPLPPQERKPGSVGVAAGPEVAVLDEAGGPLAPGEVGEVAIRGENVFRGYENDSAATDSAFANGWFRTGDEGFLDEDGYLFLRGRIKEIINRGGEKISPREVDEVLLAHPAVAQAVAFAVPHSRLGEDVGAAVVLREDAWASERELQEFAAERIADFKVPRVVLAVDEIPKGPTGKLQRRGLAEMLGVAERGPETKAPTEFAPPRTLLERELTSLWAEVLGVEQVGIHDDFFALGGDSILAAELVARLRDTSGHPQLPLTTLVWAPTVERLADELERGPSSRLPLVVPIQASGDRPPLFFVHALEGEVVRFGALARRLGHAQPFYGIRARGVEGDEPPHERLAELVTDYVAEVRAIQPSGPYFLGGVCLGAPIALEMGRQLLAEGEDVPLVALVDPRVKARKRARYLLWQLFLGARKVLQGDYGWRLVMPSRQREIWAPGVSALARRLGLDLREPQQRLFEERIREIREECVALRYPGRAVLYATLDYPLRQWFWDGLIEGGLELEPIPYRHAAVLRAPAVDVLADRLRAALSREGDQP